MRGSPLRFAVVLALPVAPLCGCVTALPGSFSEDFESGDGYLTADFPDDPRLALVAGEGVGGTRAMRATYVGGPTGSDGFAFDIPLARPAVEYTLSYAVRFEPGFQFVHGGKLPGLGPARPVTGGEPLTPEGWSARVMWRDGGRAELYVYHQDQPGTYGEPGAGESAAYFVPGRWHSVSLQVRVNAPAASANGAVVLYVDGELVDRHDNLRLRATEGANGLVSNLLFHTFHGGHGPEWAPREPDGSFATVHALFDNIAVLQARTRAAR